MLASQQLRRQRQCHSQQFTVTATKLAKFLESIEAEEVLLQQRLTDAESLHLQTAASGLMMDDEPVTSTSAITPNSTNRKTSLYGEM